MRIAIAGKGGAGKTTIAATLARTLARRDVPVVMIDADSNPNLATALGTAPGTPPTIDPLPTDLVSRRLDGPALTTSLDEVLERHTLRAPDGVRVALMGMPTHAEEGCLCSAHATVSAVLGDLGERPDTVTIVDMEASPEHLSRGTARHVDVLLLVTEPYFRSLETVRRMAELATELPIPRLAVVANKIRSERDGDAVREFCERHGLEHLVEIPHSDAIVDADVDRVPAIERTPDDPAVLAITRLADLLEKPAPQPT